MVVMAAKVNDESLPSTKDDNASLDKCISIFKSAKTDNERFAALLLVTRVVQSNDIVIDSSQRKQLFDAIGFTFINRLLKTKAVPESSLYQGLAVAILACFASDEELLFHPQMVAKVPLLNQIIAGSSDGEPIVDDAYQILIHYSSSTEGCRVLLRKQTVPCMVDVVVKANCQTDMTWTLLLNLCCLVSVDVWNAHCKALMDLITHCAVKLKTLQGLDKFPYCTHLLCLLTHTDTPAFRNGLHNQDQWLSDLCAGVGDILQGKVTSTQRDPAIVLMSVLIDLLGNGLEWVCIADRPASNNRADFFTLIVTSVCIEVRMILDESNAAEMIQKSTLLTSCYNILESVIAHLITVNDTDTLQGNDCRLSQTMVTKLYSQVTEAMMSVLNFLQQQAIKFEEEVISNEEKDLTFASARVVCAWLAEESMALQKEVNKVLPFLIKLARDTMASNQHDINEEETEKSCSKASNGDTHHTTASNGDTHHTTASNGDTHHTKASNGDTHHTKASNGDTHHTTASNGDTHHTTASNGDTHHTNDVEILRFMLPALCHLSANEKSRRILTNNVMHDILVKYYFVLWAAPPATDNKTALLTLLGVLLNLAVTEPNLAKKDNSFNDLQTHIIVNLPSVANSTDNMDILAHVVVLGLMLLRHQKESLDFSDSKLTSFFKSAVLFLKEASKLHTTESTVWSSISELWFLGVQVITQEFSDADGQLAGTLTPDILQELASLSAAAS